MSGNAGYANINNATKFAAVVKSFPKFRAYSEFKELTQNSKVLILSFLGGFPPPKLTIPLDKNYFKVVMWNLIIYSGLVWVYFYLKQVSHRNLWIIIEIVISKLVFFF